MHRRLFALLGGSFFMAIAINAVPSEASNITNCTADRIVPTKSIQVDRAQGMALLLMATSDIPAVLDVFRCDDGNRHVLGWSLIGYPDADGRNGRRFVVEPVGIGLVPAPRTSPDQLITIGLPADIDGLRFGYVDKGEYIVLDLFSTIDTGPLPPMMSPADGQAYANALRPAVAGQEGAKQFVERTFREKQTVSVTLRRQRGRKWVTSATFRHGQKTSALRSITNATGLLLVEARSRNGEGAHFFFVK